MAPSSSACSSIQGQFVVINRANFKEFRNFHFWAKITKMITRVNYQIHRIHPIYDFRHFPENFDNGYFREKFKKSYLEWIRKNLRIHHSFHCCEFPSKWQFRLENENFEIFRNFDLNINLFFVELIECNFVMLIEVWCECGDF